MSRFGGLSRGGYQSAFFDKKAVLKHTDRTTRQFLSKAGAHTRRSAMQSIRKPKRRTTVSSPGNPPYSHGCHLLRNNILFGYDKHRKSVVVGPARLYGIDKGNAPSILEYGGSTGRIKNQRRKRKKIGDGGIIQIGADRRKRKTKKDRLRKTADPKKWKTTQRRRDKNGKNRYVTFAKLKTQDQVNRSMQLEEEFYGPMFFESAMIEPRPFMGPAMDKTIVNLPNFWNG